MSEHESAPDLSVLKQLGLTNDDLVRGEEKWQVKANKAAVDDSSEILAKLGLNANTGAPEELWETKAKSEGTEKEGRANENMAALLGLDTVEISGKEAWEKKVDDMEK